MSLLSFFTRKSSSAPVARDRLQILLAHERGGGGLAGQSDLVAKLQEEILAVIAKHVAVDRDKVLIKLDRGAQVSTLEIDIEVPDLIKTAGKSAEAPKPDPKTVLRAG
ncbi:cell division topological specificity factor [Endobacter medicaginis]|jgi:cell division topological specificity factor|uniref:Cell division topological specificity factor n=1 Tax=Endobacter medicaginis TaxID=1181271 RepID=A0A850NMN8_9PROT|nr:cell division topological specificity factor MinE [Endobacter medicaginis]MBB3174290.1 cell division topological specificity factor [Endobacter medicaginis]MCX5476173.1 cell division topological specificity factor MinE [Endobacter medicaginis]NVN29679.1 cell division topological specificity factor MinE [Endobacter medicaginis]